MISSAKTAIRLPLTVQNHAELSWLCREIEALESSHQQQKLRDGSRKQLSSGPLLAEVCTLNNLSINNGADRQQLAQELQTLKDGGAPVVHVQVAAEPSAAFGEKILEWFRNNIHAYALIEIQVMPSLIGGYRIRWGNHIYDMSFGQRLHDAEPDMIKKLWELAS